MSELLVNREKGLVTVTLNRPQRLNAITTPMWRMLADVFTEIGERADDRVLILTGAGGAFCSGADLDPETERVGHPLDRMRMVANAALALHRLPTPSIARVDGVAVGAGFNLALGCDLVVASDRSRFSQNFVKRAFSPDFGGTWLLPRLVGLHKAKELVLLGDMFGAEEASKLGLVNKVVPPDELDEVVATWADQLLKSPALALSMTKALLNKSFETSMDQALEAEAQAQAVNLTGPDVEAALAAFVKKRSVATVSSIVSHVPPSGGA
jgi:enoyl-CoA hydratase/carnithine racemase